MTMTDTGSPRSIREFLDGGGDLSTLDGDFTEWLAETVVEDRRKGWMTFNAQATLTEPDQARRSEFLAAAESRGRRAEFEAQLAAEDTLRAWVRELVADNDLCDRVEAALPRSLVQGMLDDMEAETRPYVLVAEHRESYTCAVTGEQRSGRAIVVKGRGPWVRDVGLFEAPELVFSPGALIAVLSEEGAR